MTDTTVLTSRQGAVGLLVLNQPERMNRLDVPMMLAMDKAVTDLESDSRVRVIVITGADDRTFMAGGDIEDLAKRQPLSWYEEFGQLVHRVYRRIEVSEKPTIAAVNGWALGGGMELMLTTDLRIMAAEAKIGLPEIKLGLFPGGGGSQRLMRQIPMCQAKLLMFTGDCLDASQALKLGLVNEVVPRAELIQSALNLGESIARHSPLTLKLLKQSMLNGSEMPLSASLAYERSMLSVVLDSNDAHEGCKAFLEKRPAHFKGN